MNSDLTYIGFFCMLAGAVSIYMVGRWDGYKHARTLFNEQAAQIAAAEATAKAATLGAAVQQPQEPPMPIAVGEQFEYLGLNMLCTAHAYPITSPSVMVCEYADADGVVRIHCVQRAVISALQAELAGSVVPA